LLFCTQSGVITTGMREAGVSPGIAAAASRFQAQSAREPFSTGMPAPASRPAARAEGAQRWSMAAETSGTTDRSA
jgi:hypothetical protein